MIEVRRGDIWLVNLDPTVGHEIKKTRPGLIVQNDYGNRNSFLTIIAPMSSQKVERVFPFEVMITARKGLDKDSKILLNQIRAIDQKRLVRKMSCIRDEEMHQVNEALIISLGLREI